MDCNDFNPIWYTTIEEFEARRREERTAWEIEARRREAMTEVERCRNDFEYFISNYVHTVSNPCSSHTQWYELFTQKESKMQITETGKYKIRDGRIAAVTELNGTGNYPIQGTIKDGGACSWRRNGTWLREYKEDLDLVEKIPEVEPTLPDWVVEAFSVEDPDIDTEIRDATIEIDGINELASFANVRYIRCTIKVKNHVGLDTIFFDCIFEGCYFEGSMSVMEDGFDDCKLVGSMSFKDPEHPLSVNLNCR